MKHRLHCKNDCLTVSVCPPASAAANKGSLTCEVTAPWRSANPLYGLQLVQHAKGPPAYKLLCCPAGPTGKILLMPEDNNAVFIMVATGTGIAPYRAFWRRQFMEDVPNYKFSGLSWLFMGVANSDAKLYDDELQQILTDYPDQ